MLRQFENSRSCLGPTSGLTTYDSTFTGSRIFAILAGMSEDTQETRKHEIEEFRKRYLAENPPIEWANFLMTIPPGKSRGNVHSMFKRHSNPEYAQLVYPTINLRCDSDICKGDNRFFTCANVDGSGAAKWKNGATQVFLTYQCKHCEKSTKIYAIRASVASADGQGVALKLGEHPVFGESMPSRLISLIGKDRELFLNGSRAENQGLGIGASAYYRRVVENQKDHIFDEIIKSRKGSARTRRLSIRWRLRRGISDSTGPSIK